MDSGTKKEPEYIRLRLTFDSPPGVAGDQRKYLYGFEQRRLPTVGDMVADVALKFGLSCQDLQLSVDAYAVPHWCSSRVFSFDEEVDVRWTRSQADASRVTQQDGTPAVERALSLDSVIHRRSKKKRKRPDSGQLNDSVSTATVVEADTSNVPEATVTRKRRRHATDEDSKLETGTRIVAHPTSTPVVSVEDGRTATVNGLAFESFTESTCASARAAKKKKKYSTVKTQNHVEGISSGDPLTEVVDRSFIASLPLANAEEPGKDAGPQKPVGHAECQSALPPPVKADNRIQSSRLPTLTPSSLADSKKNRPNHKRRRDGPLAKEGVSKFLQLLAESQGSTARESPPPPPTSTTTLVPPALHHSQKPKEGESQNVEEATAAPGHIRFQSSSSSSSSEPEPDETSSQPSAQTIPHVVRCSPDFQPKGSSSGSGENKDSTLAIENLPLMRAPIIGAYIFYKILDLSDDCVPFISSWLKAKILRFNANTNEVALQVFSDRSRTKIPSKFRLEEDEEREDEDKVTVSDGREISVFCIPWSQLIDPRRARRVMVIDID